MNLVNPDVARLFMLQATLRCEAEASDECAGSEWEAEEELQEVRRLPGGPGGGGGDSPGGWGQDTSTVYLQLSRD